MIKETKENTGVINRTETCTMLVSISKVREGELYGHLLHGKLKLPVPYQGICDLILKADALDRRFGAAGSAWEYRFLRAASVARADILPPEYLEEIPENDRERYGWGREFYRLGTKETLYLQIAGRQNYSIQGRIRGNLTGGKYVCFRSGMELMKLLAEFADTDRKITAGRERRREEK